MQANTNKWNTFAEQASQMIIDKVNAMRTEGITLKDIADIAGAGTASVIHAWIDGNRSPANASAAKLFCYLENLGINYQKIFPADPTPTIRRIGPNAPEEPVAGDELRRLDVFDTAGAGTPKSVGGEIEPVCTIDIPPEYMAPALFALQVDGHSMEPTIPHRSVVGVGEIDNFRANEIYACHLPYEGIVIKRVDIDRKTREYVFKSDNPDKSQYPDFRLDIVEDEKLLVGRIRWILKMV